jgi:hypothetical protein
MASSIQVHTFDKPDEIRQFPNGHIEIIQTDGGEVGRSVFEPGWRWSTHVKPIAQTDSCQVRHLGYSLSGTLHIEMEGGESMDIGPGSVAMIAPGHDAWVVGDEPVVLIDWAGSSTYAKPPGS